MGLVSNEVQIISRIFNRIFKKTGEGFYEKYLHTPERLLEDLENVHRLDEEKDSIKDSIIEASKYILR